MDEINDIIDRIQIAAGSGTDIIWGYTQDKALDLKLRVTFIATGFELAPSGDLTPILTYQERTQRRVDSVRELNQRLRGSTQHSEETERDKELSLFFMLDEYTEDDIAEILSLLSSMYKEIGGDELVIRGQTLLEIQVVPEPVLV